MMIKIDELLLKYVDKFNENFPTFLVLGIEDKDLIKLLEKSIKTEKKYEPKIIEDVLY